MDSVGSSYEIFFLSHPVSGRSTRGRLIDVPGVFVGVTLGYWVR